jgi:hypothetical protein
VLRRRLSELYVASRSGCLPCHSGLSRPSQQFSVVTVYDGGLLELAFATKALRTLCENEAAATHELGTERANGLKRRLADLRAAENAGELVAGRPRQASDSNNRLKIDISDTSCLVLSSNHATIPRLDSGGVDWPNVTRVKVLRIEANND